MSATDGFDTMPGRRNSPANLASVVTIRPWPLLETLDLSTLRGARDRALLLVGFAAPFRRGLVPNGLT